MNKDNTFGALLKSIRIKNDFSQENLAKLTNHSRSAISMFESGERLPTNEFLVSLSKIFKFDFISLIENIDKYKNLDHYLLVNEILQLVSIRDDEKINKIINEHPLIQEFDYGEPLLLRQYCEVLMLMDYHKDYNKTFELCTKFLNIDPDNIQNFKPKIRANKRYYSQTINLCCCLRFLGEYEKLLTLSKILVKFLEDTYFKTDIPLVDIDFFFKRYYLISLYNQADAYFKLKDYTKALEVCKTVVSQCSKQNILDILPNTYRLNTEILFSLGDFEEGKHSLELFRAVCVITDNLEDFESIVEAFRVKYGDKC